MAKLFDTMTNLVSGMGTDRDKVSFGRFVQKVLSKVELDALYSNDWVAGTIVDAPCDDMTREWREWKTGPRKLESIENEEKRLGVVGKVNHALKMARQYGGSVIIIGDGSSDPSTPLDVDNFPKGGLKYLNVLSCHEVSVWEIIRDPMSPFFGEPSQYQINTMAGQMVKIHPSRVVRFLGPAKLELSQSIDGWGLPILQRVYDAVRNAASSQNNVASLTHEAKLDIISIPGLNQNVLDPIYRAKVIQRFALANMTKSSNGTVLMDALEKWEQKTISFNAFPDLLNKFLEIAAGAGNMPVTRLLGTSPGGLNNSNEGSIRHYYDTITSRQKIELGPALSRLDEVLIRSALGSRPADVWYDFRPLWQLTDKEKSENQLRKAQADSALAALGIMPKESMILAVQSRLIEDGAYPGLETILEEAKAQGLKPAPLVQPQAKGAGKAGASTGGSPSDLLDAAPKTLYIRRDVLNVKQIRAWAKSQGFKTIISDLHVTLIYSKAAVDWFKTAESWGQDRMVIPAGGPRMMEEFGAAKVLMFSSTDLQWRHRELIEMGCTYDHEEYQPHLTITWDPIDFELAKVQAYTGQIVLGPEIYSEIKTDHKSEIKEVEL